MRHLVSVTAIVCSLPLYAACAKSSAMIETPPPAATIAERNAREAGAAGTALREALVRYLRGRYTLESLRFYEVDKLVGWMPVSKFVQNIRSEKRLAGDLAWMPEAQPGIDQTDLYLNGVHGFAVSMARSPLANGNRLVIYATLASVKGARPWEPTRPMRSAPR